MDNLEGQFEDIDMIGTTSEILEKLVYLSPYCHIHIVSFKQVDDRYNMVYFLIAKS